MARKIRVNVTVDSELLKQAKKKLGLFGGKLSTLFNAYLTDFVKSMDEEIGKGHKELLEKFRELEKRIEKLEKD
ncbi:hypothetical protein J4233_06230 [Candidatus Pacearchaeota archaeon]|nr:hypothetical protein [Candidatus Pacearchaeota archaeon]